MSTEAWVILFGVGLSALVGVFWSARRTERQVHAAEEIQRRSFALLDRQEELIRRAESLVERLEKRPDA